MGIADLSDDALWSGMQRLAADERAATADVVEHLAEVDDRSLWKKNEYGSLFEYCIYGLRYSDGAAFKRIRAARAIRAFPPILDMMRDGRLTLAAVAMLHPHLQRDDAPEIVAKACGIRIKKLEAILAGFVESPNRRDVIRFTGAAPKPSQHHPMDFSLFALPTSAEKPARRQGPATISPPVTEAVESRSLRVAFTADERFYVKLEKARALLRHKYPDGRLEGVLGDALTALLEKRDPVLRWKASRRGRG